MSLPKTYKACVIEKAGADWAMKDMPLEDPKEGEVLLKISHCGVCHSDAHVQAGDMGPVDNRIPGHEFIGKVVALGPGADKKWKKGDVLGGAWHGGHCGQCKSCLKGLFQMCEKEAVNGVSRNGGYGEYAYLRAEAAVKIPDGIDLAQAAPLLCAGVTVFNGIRQQKIIHGGVVAVQGLGGLGHLALQYSSKMGYQTVAISSSDSKKDFATKLGAHDYIDSSKEDAAEALQKLGGADLIVVTAPNPKIIAPLVNGLAPLGKLLILAPVGDVPVNSVSLIMKGLSVHGWPSGSQVDCEDAISFAQVHKVECKVRFRGVLVMDD